MDSSKNKEISSEKSNFLSVKGVSSKRNLSSQNKGNYAHTKLPSGFDYNPIDESADKSNIHITKTNIIIPDL